MQEMQLLDSSAYLERMLKVQRPGAENVLAFYEHRVGGICKDARLMLAPLDDHLCHRGDGVFESISYRDGRLFQLDAHLERMQSSAEGLKITPPCSWEHIRTCILEVARCAGQKNGSLRILLGRGPGGFGISPAECPEASLYIIAIKSVVPSEAWYEKGLTACRSLIPAKQEYLAKIKNANYLPNVLMAEEAMNKKVDVAFSFDDKGFLAESTVANVALISADNVLLSPHLTNALSGTTISAALSVAKEIMPISFQNIVDADIYKASEVLIFGSSPLCVGITHYEDRPIAQGKTGKYAHVLREKLLETLWKEGTPFD